MVTRVFIRPAIRSAHRRSASVPRVSGVDPGRGPDFQRPGGQPGPPPGWSPPPQQAYPQNPPHQPRTGAPDGFQAWQRGPQQPPTPPPHRPSRVWIWVLVTVLVMAGAGLGIRTVVTRSTPATQPTGSTSTDPSASPVPTGTPAPPAGDFQASLEKSGLDCVVEEKAADHQIHSCYALPPKAWVELRWYVIDDAVNGVRLVIDRGRDDGTMMTALLTAFGEMGVDPDDREELDTEFERLTRRLDDSTIATSWGRFTLEGFDDGYVQARGERTGGWTNAQPGEGLGVSVDGLVSRLTENGFDCDPIKPDEYYQNVQCASVDGWISYQLTEDQLTGFDVSSKLDRDDAIALVLQGSKQSDPIRRLLRAVGSRSGVRADDGWVVVNTPDWFRVSAVNW